CWPRAAAASRASTGWPRTRSTTCGCSRSTWRGPKERRTPSTFGVPAASSPGRRAERMDGMSDYYRAPGWFTRNVFNRLVAFLTRQGISVLGSRVLAVRGRKSGEWRTTPVNLLDHDGHRYLVAPRGEAQWVRNLRVA